MLIVGVPSAQATITISTSPPLQVGHSFAYILVSRSSDEYGTQTVEWGTTTAYGNILNSSGFGPGTVDNMTFGMVGLQPGTEYHYRAYAQAGSFPPQGAPIYAADQSFTTLPAAPPSIGTGVRDIVVADSLLGANTFAELNSLGLATEWHFEYGETTALGQQGASHQLDAPEAPDYISDTLSPLIPHRQYYVRIVATNAAGTSTSDLKSFTTGTLDPAGEGTGGGAGGGGTGGGGTSGGGGSSDNGGVTGGSTGTAGQAAASGGDTTQLAPSFAFTARLLGVARVGHKLTVKLPAIRGSAPITRSFLWLQCRQTCRAIKRQGKSSLQLTRSLAGSRIRAVVTANNAAGRAISQTGLSARVKLLG